MYFPSHLAISASSISFSLTFVFILVIGDVSAAISLLGSIPVFFIETELKIESIHEEEEKKEKKKMEDDERQIFNLFEEKDQIESEELNKIAQMVLDRIQNKLSGTDFYQDSVCDAKTQVDKLITQATSYENLAQSYLGWCPFW